MYTTIIVKEEDLLPVSHDSENEVYICDGITSTLTDPEALRRRGLRFISISEHIKKNAAEKEKQAHEAWLFEKIVPLALVMYNKLREEHVTVEKWKEHYHNRNSATMLWVKTAEEAYKFLHPEDADK